MKKLLAALCCCLSFSSMSAEKSAALEGFVADELQVSINEPEQYEVQMHNLRSVDDINNESTVYYHRIKEIDVEDRTIFLEDDSKWDIGYWYKDAIQDWEVGDRLTISIGSGWNGAGIKNLDKGSLAWGSIWRWNFPSTEKADSIVKVTYGDSYVRLTLKSGFQFSLPTFWYFNNSYEVGEGVFVLQYGDSYAIMKLFCGCTRMATLLTIGNPDWRNEAQ